VIRAEIEDRFPLNNTYHCFSLKKLFLLSLPQYLLPRIPWLGRGYNKGISVTGALLHMQTFLKTLCNAPPQIYKSTYVNIKSRAASEAGRAGGRHAPLFCSVYLKLFGAAPAWRELLHKFAFAGKSQKDEKRAEPEKPQPQPEKTGRGDDEGLQRTRRIKKGGRPPK
jgi:hypothetical protein